MQSTILSNRLNCRAGRRAPRDRAPRAICPHLGVADLMNKNSVFASPVTILCKLKPSSLHRSTSAPPTASRCAMSFIRSSCRRSTSRALRSAPTARTTPRPSTGARWSRSKPLPRLRRSYRAAEFRRNTSSWLPVPNSPRAGGTGNDLSSENPNAQIRWRSSSMLAVSYG